MGRAAVFPREARSILTRTGGYLCGYTHSLQPYAGCQLSCSYCYVRELSVQRANPYRLPWSRWISPKQNAPELLAKAAARGKLAGARIFCSSATDPYTPIERRLRLTRGCLEVMAEHPPAALVVQTRMPLVQRDADLLARLPRCVVSITVTTDDESVRRAFEPDSPSLRMRVDALAALRAAGIRTQAAVSPLLPCAPARLAEWLEPACDRVVLDDFFDGDGAGGRRSGPALARLRELGYPDWARPGYADEALEVFEHVLGPDRIVLSCRGFNDLAWLDPGAPGPGCELPEPDRACARQRAQPKGSVHRVGWSPGE